MKDDRRLIEDYPPIQAIGAEASREKSVRKGHISRLHLWWARRPLVARRAAVYGALVPASRFIPPACRDARGAGRENGPDNKKQSLGRANAARFVERLCKYPGNSSVIEDAQKHILEAHAERGDDEKLGLPADDGTPASLFDSLHRILWLIENDPRNLNRFLDEARPDCERLRLVAQALAGTALAGKKDDGAEQLVATTASEQAALEKLVAN